MKLIIEKMKNIFNIKSTISEIFSILEKYKNRVAFLIDNDGVLKGSLTDGDLRRFILKSGRVDSNTSAQELMNTDVFFIEEKECR